MSKKIVLGFESTQASIIPFLCLSLETICKQIYIIHAIKQFFLCWVHSAIWWKYKRTRVITLCRPGFWFFVSFPSPPLPPPSRENRVFPLPLVSQKEFARGRKQVAFGTIWQQISILYFLPAIPLLIQLGVRTWIGLPVAIQTDMDFRNWNSASYVYTWTDGGSVG